MIVRNGGDTTEKEEREKVFVYSAIRLSIIDESLGQLDPASPEAAIETKKDGIEETRPFEFDLPTNSNQNLEPFQIDLSEIKVVDRQLKPKYLLQCAPKVTSLYINWQEELSEAPFHRYCNIT